MKDIQTKLHDYNPAIPLVSPSSHWGFQNDIDNLNLVYMNHGLLEWEQVTKGLVTITSSPTESPPTTTSTTTTTTTDASNKPLVISNPIDSTYEFGFSGNLVIWEVEGSNPDHYELELNNQVIRNSAWVDGDLISISLPDLNVGEHKFKLTIFNSDNDNLSDEVLVTIVSIGGETNSDQSSGPSPLSPSILPFSMLFIAFAFAKRSQKLKSRR